MFSAQYLAGLAAKTGFPAAGLQRQMCLLVILREIRRHPALSRTYCLRGGTALNLFWHDLPRLSVDIDLNYVASADRGAMQIERETLEKQLVRLLESLAITVERRPAEHAGGKWRLRTASALGGTLTLEIDLNYLMRIPLFGVQELPAHSPDNDVATSFPVVSLEELYAGKIKALLERSAARDLYDTFQLASDPSRIQLARLRRAVILFGVTVPGDWRTLTRSTLDRIDAEMIERELLPLLRSHEAPDLRLMKERVNALLDQLLNYDADERLFLNRFLDDGRYEPELLFGEEQGRVLKTHPAPLWRIQNLQRFR